MQFSYDWLKSWVTPQLNAEELAHLLTMSGLEVEELEHAAPEFSGVVIAEVKAIEKHPDADRLNITQVDVGTGELIQIVCGAPNVELGIKVPCAMAGAVLPGNFNIKPTKMRGQVSNGMLCSARELGLADGVAGLYILPQDAPIGTNIRDYLQLDDDILTLKITPNRADCLSIKGIAREVRALTNCAITPINIATTPLSSERQFNTQIEAKDDCGIMLTRIIENINAQAKSPLWLTQRLERSGIRAISALVDIGNYVMLELGQPMHVFDLDKLAGFINVRRAKNGETLLCLNDKEVTLSDDTLVIADQQQVLSLAGLMGGSNSSVNDDTQNILLESAFFHPAIIAGKSRQYGFGSDSSFRFERGVDFNLQQQAMERATQLIVEICGGHVAPINQADGMLAENKNVLIRLNRAEKVLGITLAKNQVATILQNLGLSPIATEEGFSVSSPSFRFDIEREEDIIEEIARVYGYENIPDNYTAGRLCMIEQAETQKSRIQVYRSLASYGYQEIVSYAFVDKKWEQDFADNHHPIQLQNPIASQMSVMRSTLIGGLIETLQNNLNRKQSRVRIFEVARVFSKKQDGNFVQTEKVAALAYGNRLPEQWGEIAQQVDFYDIKKDLERIVSQTLQFKASTHPALHPGRCADVYLAGQKIGFIGELHPRWAHLYDLPLAPVLFEIDFKAAQSQEKIHYHPVSKFQAVRRDLAFVVDEKTTVDQLLTVFKTVNNPTIEHMAIFDVYRGQGLEENAKSLAVQFILRHPDKTLLDDEVELVIQQLIAAAHSIGAKLRN